jgi:hypothetical protein
MIDANGNVVKTIMTDFTIDEISAVDRPAQIPARMVIMKRDKKDDPDGDKLAAGGDKKTASKSAANRPPEGPKMPQTEPKAADELTAAKKLHDEELAKMTKRAERAEHVAELSDEHRTHFKSLKGDASDEFLKLDSDARDEAVQAVSDANKVVYKATDGAVYRKNDDPRLVELAKTTDKEKKKRLEFEEKAKKGDLEKRATELKHIPDKDGARVALLKAIDSLPEDEQAVAMTALKAQNDRLAPAFGTVGTSEGPSADSGELDELDVMAKTIAERDKITHEQAYVKALATPEGTALYTKSLEGQLS